MVTGSQQWLGCWEQRLSSRCRGEKLKKGKKAEEDSLECQLRLTRGLG